MSEPTSGGVGEATTAGAGALLRAARERQGLHIAALAAAMALAGHLAAAVPGIAFLALIGLGMLGSATVRVFPWARERARTETGSRSRAVDAMSSGVETRTQGATARPAAMRAADTAARSTDRQRGLPGTRRATSPRCERRAGLSPGRPGQKRQVL